MGIDDQLVFISRYVRPITGIYFPPRSIWHETGATHLHHQSKYLFADSGICEYLYLQQPYPVVITLWVATEGLSQLNDNGSICALFTYISNDL